MVLQQSSSFVPYENLGENAEKSHHLDIRGVQNLTDGRD